MNDINTMQVTRSIAMSSERTGGMICIRGTYIGKMIVLRSDEAVVLGRDVTQCNCILNDIQVSRKHCMITYLSSLNKYRVIDYSKNGTFIGMGQRLEKGREYYLEPKTEIYLGNEDNLFKLR